MVQTKPQSFDDRSHVQDGVESNNKLEKPDDATINRCHSRMLGNDTTTIDDSIRILDESIHSLKNNNISENGGNTNVLAESETERVKRLRVIVGIVVMISAVSIALTIYFYVQHSETIDFTVAFASDTDRIMDGIGTSIQDNVGALQSFGIMMTIFAKQTNQTFPFYTMPSFANQASRLLTLTAGIQISLQTVISSEHRLEWEAYARNNQWWVNETKNIEISDNFYYNKTPSSELQSRDRIWSYDNDLPYKTNMRYFPQWQNYPASNPAFNWDFLTAPINTTAYSACVDYHIATISSPYNVPDPNDAKAVSEKNVRSASFQNFLSPDTDSVEPFSDLWYPITENMDMETSQRNSSKYPVVATLGVITYWRHCIKNLVPDTSRGIFMFFENSCGGSFTYEINGANVTYYGRGDQKSLLNKDLTVSRRPYEAIRSYRYSGAQLDLERCLCTVYLYPSQEYQSFYITDSASIFAVSVVMIFIFVSLVFFIYDVSVERRQYVVMNTAEKTSNIVSSLFPSVVRDQMLLGSSSQANPTKSKKAIKHIFNAKESAESTNFFPQGQTATAMASLYPETTVYFADLAGFTAWSSARTPTQVFTLLETLYGAFDKIATQRNVFKVETIGDCYVAVTGLPDPMKHHAVIMARFAIDCLNKTSELTVQLVATLGIETADLRLRIGVNSGPTTAGVLRGDKARFQLFGDTVNTAARMESTGVAGRIQVSQKTADLLIAAGKESWLLKRSEMVEVKGKGSMITYWLNVARSISRPTSSTNGHSDQNVSFSLPENNAIDVSSTASHLIEWNFSILKQLLVEVVATRCKTTREILNDKVVLDMDQCGTPLDEISETIETQIPINDVEARQVETLDKKVESQLRDFVITIAHLHKSNPFHNFEHASHVVMSTMKLIDTIQSQHQETIHNDAKTPATKDIFLDPLTRFGIVFSALIHDVDHMGISNRQLVDGEAPIAKLYRNKSIAEQNSIDVGWQLFMQPNFDALRQCLFSNSSNLKRFRQVVVNSVLGTDVFDNDLKAFRVNRWDQVFSLSHSPAEEEVNRRRMNAIVIELLIQASDVSHTMQHWKVYQKWNKRLFFEMYTAYETGYSKENPASDWYLGELWFFDNYVIPLAEKLKICGVFGVTCDEFLSYANGNRSEWEKKGKQIVAEWESEMKMIGENND